MGLRLFAVFGGCLRSSLDAATGRFFSKSPASAVKRSVVNSGFQSPKKEKPTLIVGSLGWSPVRSSVGGEAELAALLGPVLGKGLGQLGQREPVGFLTVDQGFDDVGGQSRQLEDAATYEPSTSRVRASSLMDLI